jgi:hypothetical protein
MRDEKGGGKNANSGMVDPGDAVGDGPGSNNRGDSVDFHNFGGDKIDGYRIEGHGHWGNDRINGRHHADGSYALD